MKELDKLRQINEEQLKNNPSDLNKTIKVILSDDDCFSYIDMETSIKILMDLGKTEDEAKVLYEKLIKETNI